MKFYTGIGSRNTPVDQQEKITKIAAYLESIGFVLRSGGADGADEAGEVYADFYDVPLKIFEAEWDKYGNRAGPIRNNKMAVYADALVLIWDGQSKGSRHMKEAMIALNKPVYEIILEVPVES